MDRRRIALGALLMGCLLALGAVWFLGVGRTHEPAPPTAHAPPPEPPPAVVVPSLSGRPADAPVAAERETEPKDAPDEFPPAADPIPLRIDLVDFETGVLLGGTCRFGREPSMAGPPPGVVVDPATEEANARASHEAFEATFHPSGGIAEAHIEPGDEIDTQILVRPPEGWVTFDVEPRLRFTVAANARSAVATIPLVREAILDLTVLGPDGRPADGASVVAVAVAGETRTSGAEEVGPGRLRVRGLPFLPGEPVKGAIEWAPGVTEGEAVSVFEDMESPDIDTKVPSDLSSPWSVTVRLTAPTELRILDHLEYDNDIAVRVHYSPDGVGPRGTLRVRALSWDGHPIHGASVGNSDITTDARGEAILPDLPPGDRALAVDAAGHLAASGAAVVAEDRETLLVLREPVGATLEVLVVDAEGRPRPSAHVYVHATILDVMDGVQRVDVFTDARGYRSFARVQPGRTKVAAVWGVHHYMEEVDLRDAERTHLRLVAP